MEHRTPPFPRNDIFVYRLEFNQITQICTGSELCMGIKIGREKDFMLLALDQAENLYYNFYS